MNPLVIVGDIMLDRDLDGRAERLSPDAPVPVIDDVQEHTRPGGAGLAAMLAAEDGLDVVLVTPLGDDGTSRTLRDLLAPRVRLVTLPSSGGPAEKTRVRASGHPLVRIDRSAPGVVGEPGRDVEAVLAGTGPQPRVGVVLVFAAGPQNAIGVATGRANSVIDLLRAGSAPFQRATGKGYWKAGSRADSLDFVVFLYA